MVDRGLQAQIKRLEVVLKSEENRECFDCGTRQPRWASTNLGIFICLRCAGIHRSLGTHISKVRSVSMDKWDEDMMVRCEKIGNKNGRLLYEARVPHGYKRPTAASDSVAVETSLRRKYECKTFYSLSYDELLEQIMSTDSAPSNSNIFAVECNAPISMSQQQAPLTPSEEGFTAMSASPAFVEWGNFNASKPKRDLEDIFSIASTAGGSEAALHSDDLFGSWKSNPASPAVPEANRKIPQPAPIIRPPRPAEQPRTSDTDLLDIAALPSSASASASATVDTQAILDAFEVPAHGTARKQPLPPQQWPAPNHHFPPPQYSSSPSKKEFDFWQ